MNGKARVFLMAAFCGIGSAYGIASAQPQGASAALQSQHTSRPHVSFQFERAIPGVAVPRYSIDVNEDGTGLYHAEVLTAQSPELRPVDRPLAFTPATLKSVFEAVHLLQSASKPCASRMKNIADTGTKTLAYRDAEGEGTCTYNFTENKGAEQLTNLFEGIEQTLEEGRSLDFKHRYDRLGLDAEISILVAAVEEGHAIELGNIAPTLRSIADDPDLIQRVRLRAAKLLDRAQAGG